MTDPFIEQIIRESQEDGDGRAVALLVLLAALVVFGVALWLAAGGRIAL